MNYIIEELDNGDCFEFNNTKYVLTCDFKNNRQRLAIDLSNGISRWLDTNLLVKKIALFYMNSENLIVAIKETKKDDFT
jgi:hypothetical protein